MIFQMSMCSAPLRELSNPGASGSIFYLTNDDEFIIKTVQHKEGEFLQKLLPGYYLNLDQVSINYMKSLHFHGRCKQRCRDEMKRLFVEKVRLQGHIQIFIF